MINKYVAFEFETLQIFSVVIYFEMKVLAIEILNWVVSFLDIDRMFELI